MRALVLEAPGDPSSLKLTTLPDPQPGPGEAVLRVEACGVCHHDLLVAKGVLRRGVKERVVLGHEITGRIVAVGPEVRGLKVGDRVVSLLTSACGHCERCRSGREHRCTSGKGIGHTIDGGWAEYVRVFAFSLVRVPARLAAAGACLLGCPIGVALAALRGRARVAPGETVVVTGAGGGLGVHAVQIAKALEARVLAVTSSEEKVERLQGLRSAEVLLSPELDFHWEVLALTEERGADVVMNNVGSQVFDACLESLAQYGRLLLVGETLGGETRINPALLIFKDASLLGVSGAGRRDLRLGLRLLREGKLCPITQSFALEEAPRVLSLLAERRLFGRAVLVP